MSRKADYALLASANRRSGDTKTASIADYNLGVMYDNSKDFTKAIEASSDSTCFRHR